ncbi:MAG: hypothetical protein ABUS79_21980 [Pseudomonadota bacterium]
MASDLRRELDASGFRVVAMTATTPDWRQDVRVLSPGTRWHGVFVRADEQLMIVFTRDATGAVDERFQQRIVPGDRLARRRACLSVVEYLRVLAAGDPEPAVELGGPSPQEGAPSAGATPSRAPAVVADPGSAEEKAAGGQKAPGGQSDRPDRPPRPAPPSPSSGASGDSTGSSAASPPATEIVKPPDSAGSAGQPVLVVPPEGAVPVSTSDSAAKAWKLGAGTTFGLAAAPGGPTVHLQFLWYLPLDWRLAVCVRALWPVFGGQFRTGGNDVRTWTFGAGLSLQYLFERRSPRLQPFLGVALGPRLVLTETTPVGAPQSREAFTPSVSLGAEGGIRYEMAPLIYLFLEIGLSHGWLIPGVKRLAHEEATASADVFQASMGVLFEI